MSTPEEYLAKAAEAEAQLAEAKSEAERTRLRRAHGVYLKLSRNGAEAAERATVRPERVVNEKQSSAPTASTRMQSYFK